MYHESNITNSVIISKSSLLACLIAPRVSKKRKLTAVILLTERFLIENLFNMICKKCSKIIKKETFAKRTNSNGDCVGFTKNITLRAITRLVIKSAFCNIFKP